MRKSPSEITPAAKVEGSFRLGIGGWTWEDGFSTTVSMFLLGMKEWIETDLLPSKKKKEITLTWAKKTNKSYNKKLHKNRNKDKIRRTPGRN